MTTKFEKWMEQEMLTSDGTYTIGYVNGDAAIWGGNMKELNEGDEFSWCSDDYSFGVDYDGQYQVVDKLWINKSEKE